MVWPDWRVDDLVDCHVQERAGTHLTGEIALLVMERGQAGVADIAVAGFAAALLRVVRVPTAALTDDKTSVKCPPTSSADAHPMAIPRGEAKTKTRQKINLPVGARLWIRRVVGKQK